MMIFDRTADDVENAKKIISEKVQKFETLTAEETETLERGTVTIYTLNRVENKQQELYQALNGMGYYNNLVETKTWTYSQVFDEDDLKRIVNNNVKLRKSFYALSTSPRNAIAKYRFDEFNALEKVLNDVSENIEFTVNNYVECGSIECGG